MDSDRVAATACESLPPGEQRLEEFTSRQTNLGSLKIWRALPVREKRLIGPWCFLDRYGPVSFTTERPMDVAEHPHIGLQTVSWLLEGEVLHLDSLGCEETVRPRGVNVMTSGRGIAHAEVTPRSNIGRLNGVQLWVALPDEHRHVAPSFDHVPEVPRVDLRCGSADVFMGKLDGVASPARNYSDMIGADLIIGTGGAITLPLNDQFEHGVFVIDGDPSLEGQPLRVNHLYYLGSARTDVTLRSNDGARVLLLGGPPFPTKILMWWNFVARTPEEIATAREDWENHQRFAPVTGYHGPRIPAPPLGRLARPNPAS